MPRSAGGSGKSTSAAPARREGFAVDVSAGQIRVLEMIASGAPLGDTLAELIRVIEAALPDTLGSILLLDEDGLHVRHGAAPSLPAAFVRAIDGSPIGPSAGSCGTAAYRGEAVIVEDIAGDPLWADYRQAAAAHGLRACWSTPILDQKSRVIGTFAMYLRAPGRPSRFHLTSIAMATHTAAIAIVRERGERALRQSEHRLRSILEGMTTGFMALGGDWRIISVNAHAAQIVGRSVESMLGRKYLEVFPEAEGSPFELAYRRAMAEGVPQQTESYFAPWDRWFEQRVDPTPDGLMIFFQEITERKRAEDELRRFRLAMDASADMILLIDRQSMRFVDVNPAVTRRLGYSREEMLAMGPQDVLPVSRAELERAYDALIANPSATGAMNSSYRRKDGSLLPFESTRHVLQSGGRWFIAAISRDISERLAAETRIRRLNRVYAVLSGINSLIVRERNRAELFREACRIAVEVGGFRMAWVGAAAKDGERVEVVASCGADEAYLRRLPLALRPSAADYGLAGRAIGDGRPVVVDDLASDPKITLRAEALERGLHSAAVLPLVVAGRPAGVLALYATEVAYFDAEEMKLLNELAGDISFGLEHIEKSEKVDYLAFYDQITGLANRSLFCERLAQNMQAAAHEGRMIGVGVCDIERFKTINDSLGRQAGDELLKQVARRFTTYATDARNLARLDMDHFAIMVPGLKSAESAARLTEQRLKDCFGPAFRIDGTELRVSAKLGISLYPDDGADAETLLRKAEAALKNAKAAGDKYLFYAERMTERVAEKLSLEHQLQRALEKQEFVLHYQPKVDAETRRICGVEALIRWRSEEFGLVPPAKFIPLMEETGLILEAGAWALRRAAQDYHAWQQAGLRPPRVAVNVSPVQLRRREFVDVVAQAVGHGTAPCGIDLEITESLIMEDIESNILKLKRLRELGLSVAIDDFGTGYSSLAYLARLPVQTLKIDRSFIITMLQDSGTMTLVQTIVSLAHSLNLKVVAEGVDEEEQAKMLRLLRCDEMQGYLFSQPVPAEAFAAMLGDGKPLG